MCTSRPCQAKHVHVHTVPDAYYLCLDVFTFKSILEFKGPTLYLVFSAFKIAYVQTFQQFKPKFMCPKTQKAEYEDFRLTHLQAL